MDGRARHLERRALADVLVRRDRARAPARVARRGGAMGRSRRRFGAREQLDRRHRHLGVGPWLRRARACAAPARPTRRGGRGLRTRAPGRASTPSPGPRCSPQPKAGGPRRVDALRAAIASRPPVQRLALLLPAVELALDAGQHEAARGFAAELSADAGKLGAAGAQAWAWHARALLELHAARPHAAADAARTASDLYRSQHLQYGLARAHEVLARAERDLGRPEEAAADAATALAIYRRLGATSDADTARGRHRRARRRSAHPSRGAGPRPRTRRSEQPRDRRRALPQ